MLIGLVMAFLLQTVLVYADLDDTVKIEGPELTGRRLWQKNNCQSCHQLHGFGGFLGPDLTNATTRVTREQFDLQLATGNEQMPAFTMEDHEMDAIWAYLTAMNETGTGQARNPALRQLASLDDSGNASAGELSGLGRALTDTVVESLDRRVMDGLSIFRTGTCTTCHVLFARSAIGAPDLTLSGGVLTQDELAGVLRAGRPPKMPVPNLTPGQQESVRAFITFVGEHRAEILERRVIESSPYWSSLPWWEYE